MMSAAVTLLTAAASAVELAPHPRALISSQRLERLEELAADGDERYLSLRAEGMASLHSAAGEYLPAGPARSTWADAAAGYALLYLLETDPEAKGAFAEEALVYMGALADDLAQIGDGAGGVDAVGADDWSALANHGLGLVTAYDWLYGYREFRADRKTHFAVRIGQWLDRAEAGGAAKRAPWDRRFMTFFAVKALAAVVTYEENPAMQISGLREVRTRLVEEILPALEENLAGGYPPDGWHYMAGCDRLLEALMTLENGLGEVHAKPFFRDVLRAVIHSTEPNRREVYDGGAWPGGAAGHPAPAGLVARLAAYLDGPEAAWARFYLADFLDEGTARLSTVESLIYLDPQAEKRDFTLTEQLSYFSLGAGVVFMRSSWDRDAFWAAFQSGGPRVSEFQNLDKGHIEIRYRGEDLLIDAGMCRELLPGGVLARRYSAAAAAHNTIVIEGGDGAGQNPEGGGETVQYEDSGKYVYVRADLTDAYRFEAASPRANLAEKVEREVFYLRPNTLIVRDTVKPVDPEAGRYILWNFPHGAAPSATGAEDLVTVAGAALKIFSMLPEGAKITVFRQRGVFGDPQSDFTTWGQRTAGESGAETTRFLTVLTARPAREPRPQDVVEPYTMSDSMVLLVAAGRAVGVAGGEPDRPVTFSTPLVKEIDLYVTGLRPRSNYRVTTGVSRTARIRVSPANRGRLTSPAGVLAVRLQLAVGGR